MVKHGKSVPCTKKPCKHTTRAMKPPKSHARLNGWSLFLSELKGTAWSVPPGMDRFTHTAAMWHALPKAVRDDFKKRAKVIREAVRRKKLQDHPSQNGMAERSGVYAAAQTIGGADVAAYYDSAYMSSGPSLIGQPSATHVGTQYGPRGPSIPSPFPYLGPAVLSPPATPADGSGLDLGAPRTDPMRCSHGGHPPTPLSTYPSADNTYYDAGALFPNCPDCLPTWRPMSSSAGHHVERDIPPVATSGSGSPPSLSSISQDVYIPSPNATASSARYPYYSLPASTTATPAHSPMPGINPLLTVPVGMGHHVWTPPETLTVPDDVNWSTMQVVDPSYDPHYVPGQVFPGAATSSVNFWDGGPHGGVAQAMAFSPTDVQWERLATAEEWVALRDGLQGNDGNSGDGRVPMGSAPDMLDRCSPASRQAVIELLASSLGHGGGAPFYPTPSPSASSPVEGMRDAICDGSSQAADTPPREHWEDAPWTNSTLLVRLEERLSQPAQQGASGDGSVTPTASFMAMLS